MRNIAIISSLIFLAACGGGEDKAPTPGPSQSAAPKAVAFDPAFVKLAGSWRSEPGSVSDDRFLQIDVASAGGYTIDVRKSSENRTEVSETGRGKLTLSGSKLTAVPGDTQGPFLKKLGSWTAEAGGGEGEGRTMTLRGADGTSVSLKWRKL